MEMRRAHRLVSCGGTGALLGYLSLNDIHRAIDKRYGTTAGWSLAVGSLMLCGFGIYLGRFLRLNSWYPFTQPMRLLGDIGASFVHPGTHPHPIPVTLVYGFGLVVGYLALRASSTSMRSA